MKTKKSISAAKCVEEEPLITHERRINLSAVIVTRNEERKIRRCLEALHWLDEIVIVDQSSSDDTISVCREYTDKVFVVSQKNFCEPDRPVAVSKTKNEWVLYVDADEAVSPELRLEISSLLSGRPKYNCYYILRKNIFMGKWIKGSGWHPCYLMRLFRKGFVSFSEAIHTDLTPLGECGYLKQPIIHYTCESFEEYLTKVNRYTNVLAHQAYLKNERLSGRNCLAKLLIIPLAYSLHKFFFKKGFKDGFQGVLIAFLTFFTLFIMNTKIWEMQKKCR